MRLIDADALINTIEHSGGGRNTHNAFLKVADYVRTMPTVEPKHGHWIYTGIRGRFPTCQCSVCEAYENADWAMIQEGANYCPHCGAKMDEVEE